MTRHYSIAASLLLFVGAACAQPVVYQRATLGTTGITSGGGIAVSTDFYTGWRFQVTGGPVTTSSMGAHLFAGTGSVFGAIVQLTGPNDDPDAFDLTTPDVIATTIIPLSVPGCSCEFSAPITATLTDGWYLAILGAGRFGATGSGSSYVAQDASTAVAGAQLNVTYRQPTSPFGQGGPFLQGSVGRIFVNGDFGTGSSCYPNCDGSTAPPILNALDFGCFLSKFAAGDTYANCDNSTAPPTLNALDFGCFLSKFAAGCS